MNSEKISVQRVLELAFVGAVEVWSKAFDKKCQDYNNQLLRERENKAWEELTVLDKLLTIEEVKKIISDVPCGDIADPM